MTEINRPATAGALRTAGEWGIDTDRAQRLVYIPTHRPFQSVLGQVAAEVSAASIGSEDEFQLLLIDDRPQDQARANRDAAERAAHTAGITVNWMGQQEWATFVERLLARDETSSAPEALPAALLKPTGSYAAGMNKASLFAAFLGASSLHRRDSDEFPGHRASDGLTSLEVEVAALGMSPTLAQSLGGRPYFVGTEVHGEPTKDHRDLIAGGDDLQDRLEAITSTRRRAPRPPVVPKRARLNIRGHIDVERDETGRTEVGVSASRRVYEWIPEMPVVATLGTDHFQKGILYQLGLPIAWHPLTAVHVYDPDRADQRDTQDLERYVMAEFRYVVLRQYWNRARSRIQARRDEILVDGERFVSSIYADAFREALAEGDVEAETAADMFIDIHREAMRRTGGEVKARHAIRIKELQAGRGGVVPYVREAIREFTVLVEAWPHLVAAARAMGEGPAL